MGETSIVNDGPGAATITAERWVYGGESLARMNGQVVLVPYMLPGERARIEPGRDIHAELVEIVTPSLDRVTPPCPIFTRCGGCHYQHAAYEYQLARKVEILREQLRRVGKIEFEGEIETISGPALGYRNRSQFHIQDGRIGYLASRSHTLVPVDGDCPISSPRLNQALAEMRARLGEPKFPKFVRSLEIFTNEADVQVNVLDSDRPIAKWFYDWCGSVVGLDYQTASGSFRISPKSFFQVNRFLIDKLVEAALGTLADTGAEGTITGKTALDLYAGVGLFALPLAKRFERVTAVESGMAAVRDLEFNAARAGVLIETRQTRVEEFLARCSAMPDFVLADPPRMGLGKSAVAHLKRLAPPDIVIVSCDPATLARDLAGLLAGDPGYTIESMALIDLFPQTYHMETVARITRRSI